MSPLFRDLAALGARLGLVQTMQGDGHARFTNEATGDHTTVSTTAFDGPVRAIYERELYKTAQVRPDRQSGRYTNKDRSTDFTIERAKAEQQSWHRTWGPQVDAMYSEIQDIDNRVVAMDPRRDHNALCTLLRRRAALSERLQEFHQPVPDLPEVS